MQQEERKDGIQVYPSVALRSNKCEHNTMQALAYYPPLGMAKS